VAPTDTGGHLPKSNKGPCLQVADAVERNGDYGDSK
jgi:hypothetical protein